MKRHFPSLTAFLGHAPSLLRGPVAVVLVEDGVEVSSTLRHHLACGFATVVAVIPDAFTLPPDLAETVVRVDYDASTDAATPAAVNAMIQAAPGIWMYYCFNAEYLFYPFSDTRTVGEMLAFHEEERRDAMLAYVIDLYADDLDRFPNAVSLERAHLDRSGYYAQSRAARNGQGSAPDRQYDFFGGLRWRYEEHIPAARRRIDRIALFRTCPGLELHDDHTFNVEEYNTYACAWHNNLTASICSFRTAKALKTNPGSTFDIESFTWHNSTRFEWSSRQLLDLGLMEPGQWF